MLKTAVKVEELGISFETSGSTLQKEIIDRGKNWLTSLRGGERVRQSSATKNWIFRNLNFEIQSGEVVGILGGNGSGKTTLLKILSRVLYPTEGRAIVEGRVASLLAVGTGFNHAYSGRENIYLNGMILGLSRSEVRKKYASIVEFADIGDAIDMQVKNYSTGMRARLAFAVATCLDSDIVMLDEVLAVGDAGFREKSLDVIRNMKREGRTILLVSHSMSAIESFCDRAMVLRNGGMGKMGEPQDVIKSYLDGFKTIKEKQVPLRDRQDREGSGILRIVDYRLETSHGLEIHVPTAGNDVVINMSYESEGGNVLEDVEIGIVFFSNQGHKLARFATENLRSTFHRIEGQGNFKLTIPRFPFATGTYLIGFRVLVAGSVADYIPNGFEIEVGAGDFFGTGVNDEHSPVFIPHEWDVESSQINTTKITSRA